MPWNLAFGVSQPASPSKLGGAGEDLSHSCDVFIGVRTGLLYSKGLASRQAAYECLPTLTLPVSSQILAGLH